MRENPQVAEQGAMEIDLFQLARALWHKKWYLIASAVLCAIIFFAYSVLYITPMYRSSIMFYVNTSKVSIGGTSVSLSSGDLNLAKSLVDTYVVILQTEDTYSQILAVSNGTVPYTVAQLKNMVSAGAVNETEIFRVTVEGESPSDILKIASLIGEVLPQRIGEVVAGSKVEIVNQALLNSSRISPSYTTNAFLGFMVGFVLCAAFVVVLDLINNAVRSEDYLNQTYDIPILSVVPDMSVTHSKSKYGKYGYYNAYYYKRPSSKGGAEDGKK